MFGFYRWLFLGFSGGSAVAFDFHFNNKKPPFLSGGFCFLIVQSHKKHD